MSRQTSLGRFADGADAADDGEEPEDVDTNAYAETKIAPSRRALSGVIAENASDIDSMQTNIETLEERYRKILSVVSAHFADESAVATDTDGEGAAEPAAAKDAESTSLRGIH